MTKKGSNQYLSKYRIVSVPVMRDIWMLISFMALLFMLGREYIRLHPTLSPCPNSGCAVTKIEAANIEASIELKQLKIQQSQPTTENIIAYIAYVFKNEPKHIQIKAINCFYSESGLNPKAYNYNPAYTDKKGIYHEATEDYGIAQINTVHKMTVQDMQDFKKNIDKAYQIYKQRKFSAWYAPLCQ